MWLWSFQCKNGRKISRKKMNPKFILKFVIDKAKG